MVEYQLHIYTDPSKCRSHDEIEVKGRHLPRVGDLIQIDANEQEYVLKVFEVRYIFWDGDHEDYQGLENDYIYVCVIPMHELPDDALHVSDWNGAKHKARMARSTPGT